MKEKRTIHWFRQDLRLTDNPSLYAASEQGSVLPVYIYDDVNNQNKPLGAASKCWLHHSLKGLNQQLNGQLLIRKGDPLKILQELINEYEIDEVHWNRCYEPWQIQRDTLIKKTLKKQGIETTSHHAFLLWEPWEIAKKDGTHFKVFTPFYRKGCLGALPPREPLPKPEKTSCLSLKAPSDTIESLELLPSIPWDKDMIAHWEIGEAGARKQLEEFIEHGLNDYQKGRDIPSEKKTSRLSPHLHWGEISPHQIWHEVKKRPQDNNTDSFLSELGWREFSYHLLYFYPDLPQKNLQEKFNTFPWKKNDKKFTLWQKGITGYPIVDAGMRELWQTGYMHNRVRMIVASFLVKNLKIHWHDGENWFWDCLVDADLASNSASWQWVAGCGADASPFFRIFNPILQGKKFDPEGTYTKHYVPELKALPNQYLFTPWEAPSDILKAANIKLGTTYPNPIVDLQLSRQQALEAYKELRNE